MGMPPVKLLPNSPLQAAMVGIQHVSQQKTSLLTRLEHPMVMCAGFLTSRSDVQPKASIELDCTHQNLASTD